MNYSLHECLGTGAFSEVYRATRAGKTFALKLMKTGTGAAAVAPAEVIEAMRYEFWVLKDCHHPNVVAVHDFGAMPDGRIFLVEELLVGEDLARFCAQRPFAQCEGVLLGTLDGLAALHGWNVVHGDLKPQNVMAVAMAVPSGTAVPGGTAVPSGTAVPGGTMVPGGIAAPHITANIGWQAKILDFGLARMGQAGGVRRQGRELSSPAAVLSDPAAQEEVGGTPGTLAPEIILGEAPDARSDLYSLGVTFYEALTGVNPFARSTLAATLAAHLTHTPESIGSLRADVPPAWQEWLARLLSKDREMRPANAAAARALLSEAGFTLTPGAFVGRAAELASVVEALKAACASGKQLAVLAHGEEGAGVTRFLREALFRFLANHPEARDRIAWADTASWRQVTAPLILVDGGKVVHQTVAAQDDDGGQGPCRPPAASGDGGKEAPDSALAAGVERNGMSQRDEGVARDAGAVVQDALATTHGVLEVTIPPLTRAELGEWLAQVFHLTKVPAEFVDRVLILSDGRPRLAWEVLGHLAERGLLLGADGRVAREALGLIDWDRVLPADDAPAHVHASFDFVLEELKIRLRRRETLLLDPLWQRLQTLAGQGVDEVTRLSRRAQVLILGGACRIEAGDLARAREDLKAALELLGQDSSAAADRIRARNYLAYIALRQHETGLAIALYEESAREMAANLDGQTASTITNLDLGTAYLAAGRHDEAIARLREECRLSEGQGHAAGQLVCLYHLAVAHFEKAELQSAAGYFQRAISLARVGRDGAYLLRALNGLGNVLRRTAEWEAAVHAYGEALELALALKDPLSVAVAAQNRAGLFGAHGRYAESRADLDTCFKQLGRIPARYAYEKGVVGRALVQLGELEAKLGRMGAARAALDRAWHMAQDDTEMVPSRFRILFARCRLATAEKRWQDFDHDFGLLNHYADDEGKRQKVATLRRQRRESQPGQGGEGIAGSAVREENTPGEAIRSTEGITGFQGGSNVVFPASGELEALLRITRELTGEMETAELLRRVLGHAIELAGAELGVLLLVDADGELAPYLSLNADLGEELSAISLSVARQSLKTGQPVLTADAAEDPNFNRVASVMALQLRSILGLPVIFKGKALGVLYLSHRHRHALFGPKVLALLTAFAHLAAIAIENHRLLDFHRRAEVTLRHELERTQADLLVAREQARSGDSTLTLLLQGRELMTRSSALRAVLAQAERIAASEISAVIHGESGSGKELLARFLHSVSARKDGPFIAINCGAIPQNLVESELFGHAKGSFTGAAADRVGLIEAANGGTLFLDEIADLPLSTQVKLLRVLQEREVTRLGEVRPRPVNVRVVAASHKVLKSAVARGEFREDLYYRLAAVELTVPPLRERREDIPLLSGHFLATAVKRAGKKHPVRIAAGLLKLLSDYDWPGNIRELANVIEVGAALSDESVLTKSALPRYLLERLSAAARPATDGEGAMATGWYDPRKSWKEHERLLFASALLALDFDIPRVAKSLAVGPATVYKRLRELRVRELERDWRKQSLPYQEGVTLAAVRAEVFAQAFRRHPGHPYRVARELGVAPVTAYRHAPG